jgi:uncharacterized membrane protein
MTALFGLTRQRWPAVALVASLLLNGFLIGMLLVDRLGPEKRFTASRAVAFELRRLSERLPDDAVDRISAELRTLEPSIEGHIARLQAMRAEIRSLAAEPSPDRAAIDEQLAALRAEGAAMQEEVQRATYDVLLALPPETRARLAEEPAGG